MSNNTTFDRAANFFKDDKGHVVLFSWPNIPLASWILFNLLSFLVSAGHTKTGFETLSTAALFTWAYLEITSGVSYFRRVLGAVVMYAVVVGFFK